MNPNQTFHSYKNTIDFLWFGAGIRSTTFFARVLEMEKHGYRGIKVARYLERSAFLVNSTKVYVIQTEQQYNKMLDWGRRIILDFT